MLSFSYYDQFSTDSWYITESYVKTIQLMFSFTFLQSVKLWPKVITLSSAYFYYFWVNYFGIYYFKPYFSLLYYLVASVTILKLTIPEQTALPKTSCPIFLVWERVGWLAQQISFPNVSKCNIFFQMSQNIMSFSKCSISSMF